MSLFNKIARRLKRQEGQLLIEVLIALAILGIVVVAFLSGLATASRSIIIADERTTAESLTRTELEYVKSQPLSVPCPSSPWSYKATQDAASSVAPSPNNPGTVKPSWWVDASPHTLPAEYAGYSVIVFAEGCDVNGDNIDDKGIWKVTVKVYHSETPNTDDLVLTTEDYKVNREEET